jgi:hypothetical protein
MFRTFLPIAMTVIMLFSGSVPLAGTTPVPHDYLIATTAPLSAGQVDQLRAAGATITYVYKNFGGAAVKLLPSEIDAVRALPFVTSVDEDTVEELASFGTQPVFDTALPGYPTWLDQIDAEKNTTYDGSGVWIALLDDGFFPNWRDYFNEDSILTDKASAFVGGDDNPNANLWDVGSDPHAMGVASIILGFRLVDKPKEGGGGDMGLLNFEGYLTGSAGTYWVPGVAPGAKIIPVKVCGASGCFFRDYLAGQDYITGLKIANPDQPIIINVSFGGRTFNQLRRDAQEAAIKAGVVIVAVAGNGGNNGVIFPANYEPVISAGAGGWTGQWNGYPDKTWWLDDVPETGVDEVFVAPFSARQRPGQYLDVVSNGSNVLVPYPCPHIAAGNFRGKCAGKAIPGGENANPIQYFFGNGTSWASPTIAGIVALMLDKNPTLNNADAKFGTMDPTTWGPGSLELLLESTAVDIPPGSPTYGLSNGSLYTGCWELTGCELEATGYGWVFVDKALDAVP